jgi:hypothetical protein
MGRTCHAVEQGDEHHHYGDGRLGLGLWRQWERERDHEHQHGDTCAEYVPAECGAVDQDPIVSAVVGLASAVGGFGCGVVSADDGEGSQLAGSMNLTSPTQASDSSFNLLMIFHYDLCHDGFLSLPPSLCQIHARAAYRYRCCFISLFRSFSCLFLPCVL